MKLDMASEKRKRDLERIRRFRLLDDTFMKVVLKDNIPAVQEIIRILLRRDDIIVIKVETQDELTKLYGHSVRLDVLAQDSRGRLYNIEIQRASAGVSEKRARYHLGSIDTHRLPAGTDFSLLPEIYVIFITENDMFGEGLPFYTVERIVLETGKFFDDFGHIIYANAAYRGDDPFGKLMADFRETEPEKMHYSSLAERVEFYKNTEGGFYEMCQIMEEVRDEGRKEGRKEGRASGILETRRQMVETLLQSFPEDVLLYGKAYRGLQITRDEIKAAKKQRGLS